MKFILRCLRAFVFALMALTSFDGFVYAMLREPQAFSNLHDALIAHISAIVPDGRGGGLADSSLIMNLLPKVADTSNQASIRNINKLLIGIKDLLKRRHAGDNDSGDGIPLSSSIVDFENFIENYKQVIGILELKIEQLSQEIFLLRDEREKRDRIREINEFINLRTSLEFINNDLYRYFSSYRCYCDRDGINLKRKILAFLGNAAGLTLCAFGLKYGVPIIFEYLKIKPDMIMVREAPRFLAFVKKVFFLGAQMGDQTQAPQDAVSYAFSRFWPLFDNQKFSLAATGLLFGDIALIPFGWYFLKNMLKNGYDISTCAGHRLMRAVA